MTTLLEFERAIDLKTHQSLRIARNALWVLRQFKHPPASIKRSLRLLVRWTAFTKLEAKSSGAYTVQMGRREAASLLKRDNEEMIAGANRLLGIDIQWGNRFIAAATSLDHWREEMLNASFVRSVLESIAATDGHSGRKATPFRKELLDLLVLLYGRLVGRPTFAPRARHSGLWEWLSLWADALELPSGFSEKETRNAVERYRTLLASNACEVSGNSPV